MSNSPITNRIGGVFVHVKDMQRSIKWYNDILGLSEQPVSDQGNIYVVPTLHNGGSSLLLDANTALTQPDGRHPQFMFATPDIQKAYDFLHEKGVKIICEIEHAGPVSFFAFEDPDGTILMACQDHQHPESNN